MFITCFTPPTRTGTLVLPYNAIPQPDAAVINVTRGGRAA